MVRGTSPAAMLTGVIIFFIMQIAAIGLALMGGTAMDIIVNALSSMGWYALSPEWDTSGQTALLINVFYAVPILISLIGIYILVATILNKTRNQEEEEEEYYVPGP